VQSYGYWFFVWLYKDQNKISIPSKRYKLAGIKDVEVSNEHESNSATNGSAKEEWKVSDIDGLDFSNVKKNKKPKSKQAISVDEINGMDFSNYNRK
jgi:PTS system galactitol-specific IIC component